jgi:hypothetical protein
MRATPTTEELMERRELAVVIAILVVSAVVSIATLFEVVKIGMGLL